MRQRYTVWRRALLVLAGTAMLGALVERGPAQGPVDGPDASEDAMRKLWDKYNQRFYNLLRGDKDKEAQHIAEGIAKWYVYRVNWVTVKADSIRMAGVVKDYEDAMKHLVLPAKNREFQRLFAGELSKCLEKVLALNFNDRSAQTAVLHAGMMLPSAAKLKHEKLDQVLIGLVKNPKTHDAVKNYALKSLGEFFPADVVNILKPAASPAKRNRDVDRVTVLMNFLGEKPGNNVTPEAFKFIRRHAVRSLAQTGVPAVEFDKTGKIHAPAVIGLLRVLSPVKSKNALDPAATLGERLDAAIGFCNIGFGLQIDPDDLYQPEIGLYLVGRHFFPDFVDAYRNDYADGKLKPLTGAPTARLPWKIDAKSFDVAVQTFVKNAKTHDVEDKAKKFAAYAKPLLDYMVAHKQILDAVDRPSLETMLRPKEGAIFRKIIGPNFLE